MIHLVYPHDRSRIAAPWSIGNHLAAGLRKAGHQVMQHDWEEHSAIHPDPGDILLGHPHPEAGRVFRNSVCGPWKKVVAISPWNGSEEYEQNIEYVVEHVDDFMFICGQYWQESGYPRSWVVKAWDLDMAVNPAHFPPLDRPFNPPGQRRFLYIGCTLPIKGPEHIARVAELMPGRVGHIGHGSIPGTARHGYLDMSHPQTRQLLARYDFLVTLADHDANPTTVLEAMCWGLIPLCSEGSGYVEPDVQLVTPETVAAWQDVPTEHLESLREQGYNTVRTKFTWERFVSRVLEVIS